MPVKIKQSYEYVGDDYWNWSAWITGSKKELSDIESVTWYLHSSFTPSTVTSRDRSDNFRLVTSGWGTFVLRAKVSCADGRIEKLRHPLDLQYPNVKPKARTAVRSSKEVSPRTVFLTYDSEDMEKATAVRRWMEGKGLRVVDPALSITDESVANTAHLVQQSDGIVALVGTEFPTTLLTQDVKEGLSLGKPMLVLKELEIKRVLGLPRDLETHTVSWADQDSIAAALSSWVTKL